MGKTYLFFKSLALALHLLGFQEEALPIEAFGITDLQGCAVDAFCKVICFAKTLLLMWIITKCVNSQQLLIGNQPPWEYSHFGVYNASCVNCFHEVTVYGGFINNTNKLIAIPLCQEALYDCTWTQTYKSSFVNFCRIALFIARGSTRKR